MGQYNTAYHKVAVSNTNKFCHGFGIFQYDIQFCTSAADDFIDRKWKDFDASLGKCLAELTSSQKRAGLAGRKSLSSDELVHVAIAYNAGSYNPARGLKQGHKDSSGKYYGELIAQYLAMAAGV